MATTPRVRWLNDHTLFSSFSDVSFRVPSMSGRLSRPRSSITTSITPSRARNGTCSWLMWILSMDRPPNTTPVTKYGARVVPTELAVPPTASRCTDWVPGTSQAVRYGLITTCRMVAEAPTMKEPSRKMTKPTGITAWPTRKALSSNRTVYQEEAKNRKSPSSITAMPRSSVPL